MKQKSLIFSKETPLKKATSQQRHIFNFLNLQSLYYFNNVPKLQLAIKSTNAINFPDGSTIAKKLQVPKQRGPSFTKAFLNSSHAKSKKHFFIGHGESSDEQIEKLPQKLKIPNKNIKTCNPFTNKDEFSVEDKINIIQEINQFKPDYLWICVGNPKQEILSHQIFNEINVKKIFNVGAAIDFILKNEKEAPRILQNLNIEWIYLGFTNPKRTLKKIGQSFIALRYLDRIEKV
jgi:N-acetylglucosaminyldiphosphoundecaprenol N-acetyl-beta-D-mannosaminyltransferase